MYFDVFTVDKGSYWGLCVTGKEGQGWDESWSGDGCLLVRMLLAQVGEEGEI